MIYYNICRYCRYSTTSRSNFQQHRRTQKHKENFTLKAVYNEEGKLVDPNPEPLTQEQMNEIIEENTKRRLERGSRDLLKSLIGTYEEISCIR